MTAGGVLCSSTNKRRASTLESLNLRTSCVPTPPGIEAKLVGDVAPG